jgi:hypothetical protein
MWEPTSRYGGHRAFALRAIPAEVVAVIVAREVIGGCGEGGPGSSGSTAAISPEGAVQVADDVGQREISETSGA